MVAVAEPKTLNNTEERMNTGDISFYLRTYLDKAGFSVPKYVIDNAVNSLIQEMSCTIQDGGEVTLAHFGKFHRRIIAGKQIKSPLVAPGTSYESHYGVRFTPFTRLKALVRSVPLEKEE
jgi:nucleoid DNA-binding protein